MGFQTENRRLLNKQVEIIQRIENLEERVQGLMERFRQLEDRLIRLEKTIPARPTYR
jgi:hypothetical protein